MTVDPLTPTADDAPRPDAPEPVPPDGPVNPNPPSESTKAFRVAREWIILGVAAVVIALVVRAFLFQAFYIPSESMVPTLRIHDRVLVNKLSYKLHPVHRGDIVVFKAPKDIVPPVKDLVKRVIAIPGDTVEGKADGFVYVNGKKQNESYVEKNPGSSSGAAFPLHTVPPDSYWVMGDNRGVSEDSRFFGYIPKRDIVGRVFIRIWPLNRIDLL